MPFRVLPFGRVLYGGFGEGQACDYAAGFIMPARLLPVRGVLRRKPIKSMSATLLIPYVVTHIGRGRVRASHVTPMQGVPGGYARRNCCVKT